jgi:hypothetical protein
MVRNTRRLALCLGETERPARACVRSSATRCPDAECSRRARADAREGGAAVRTQRSQSARSGARRRSRRLPRVRSARRGHAAARDHVLRHLVARPLGLAASASRANDRRVDQGGVAGTTAASRAASKRMTCSSRLSREPEVVVVEKLRSSPARFDPDVASRGDAAISRLLMRRMRGSASMARRTAADVRSVEPSFTTMTSGVVEFGAPGGAASS